MMASANRLGSATVLVVVGLGVCAFMVPAYGVTRREKVRSPDQSDRAVMLSIPHLQANSRKRPRSERVVPDSQRSTKDWRQAGWAFGNSSRGQKIGWAQPLKFDCTYEAAYKEWADQAPLPNFKMSSRHSSEDFRDYCTVETMLENFSWSGIDVRIDRENNHGVVVILPNQFKGQGEHDDNIYHSLFWNLDVWCTVLAGELLDNAIHAKEKLTLLQGESKEGPSQWARDLLVSSIGQPGLLFNKQRNGEVSRQINARLDINVISPSAPHRQLSARFAVHVNSKVPRVPDNAELWDSFGFKHEQSADRSSILLGKRVKDSFGASSRSWNNGSVLLLLRTKTRMLFDLDTRSASTIFEALLAAGLPAEVLCFDDTFSLEEQVHIMARAAVVISIHGAQLTNLAWMRPRSVVIEISLRYGWCNDPWVFPPVPPCVPYHKSDYANMARFFDVKYLYYDAEYIGCRAPDPSGLMNPIVVNDVYVDSTKLAIAAQNAYRYATRWSDSQGS